MRRDRQQTFRRMIGAVVLRGFSIFSISVSVGGVLAFAQPVLNAPKAAVAETAQALPSAPMPQTTDQGNRNGGTGSAASANNSAPPGQAPASSAQALTLKDAEALALKNNPQISVARLIALAAHQVTREARSSLWPTAVGNITGVDAESGSRITAGLINNPSVYERAAAGASVSQLITDFGRTSNLISSASYAEKAQSQNAAATKQQILLAVNTAFFNALQAQAVLTVAQQTVKERQAVADQIGALYKNKLKSELDFSFASVNLAQAQLLLLDAENNKNAALATLSMVLGYSTQQDYELVEDTSPMAAPPATVDDLINEAFTLRPEILSLEFQYQSAEKFQKAERDLLLPTVTATGVVGVTPVGNDVVAPSSKAFNNTYAAVGGNIEIPLFNGFLFTAREREASLKAQATDERLRDMRDLISRDVRTSWLNANTAYQRLDVTRQLLEQAKLALDLAQSRYKLGLASIVEISQAQLQETQAEISNVQAGYDYRLALAVLQYQTRGI